ncbi:MAG TPA: Crp/Fnr family transcriptional regulator [Gammaproteobacteria bacterium]|nr:Crp/Fnr family transcriptional regulator [Gammaproteobacteria bacterium]
MVRIPQRKYCTDVTWLGRADCRHCNIRQLMMFSGLPEPAFEDVLAPIENFCYPAATVLFEEGKRDKGVFSIRSGIIKLVSLTSDGTQRIVSLLGRGGAIGLELLENNERYRQTAIALTPVDVCQIPMPTMVQLDARYPQLCQQVRSRLQEALDRADQWIVTLGSGPARKRIANLLLLMLDLGNDPHDAVELLAREDMAAIIGSSVETASRVIAELKRQDILRKTGTHRHWCDVKALESIARENR